METLTVFGEFLKPWIYAILFKTAMTSTWTGLSGRTHLWAQSQILSQPKRSREKKHPSLQVKSSTLCRKRKLLAQSWRKLLLTSNNRSIANCVQRPRLLYARAVRFTSAHLTQISRGSLNAFGPFLSSRIKRGPSLERWARARALKHQHLSRSPSCLILTLCRSSVSVFTAPLEVLTLSAPFTPSHLTLNELEFPVEMVLTSLKQLAINKATGSDGISMPLLKETADPITPSLTMVFNKSLRLGIFSGDWKLANIVSIFKKGKTDFVENYRFISLLPVISKVLERCVLAGLPDHISHLISPKQHDFLAGRSCVTPLTSVLHYIGGQLDAGKQIDIIYLDMSKAFDKVDHTKLLGRLHLYGITSKLHDRFRSYLQRRK